MEELGITISQRISTALLVEFIEDFDKVTIQGLNDGFQEFIAMFERVKESILFDIRQESI